MPYKLLAKLLEAENAVNFKALAQDAPHVLERCEVTMLLFKKYKAQIQELAPSLEQLKGLVKGFELAIEVSGHHKKLLQEACKAEKISKDEFIDKAQLVDAICQSLREGAENRKEEFLKAAGRIEGMFTSAMGALEQIKGFLQNLQTQKEFMKANPDLFSPDQADVQPSNPAGGNGQSREVVGNRGTDLAGATLEPKGAKPAAAQAAPEPVKRKGKGKGRGKGKNEATN